MNFKILACAADFIRIGDSIHYDRISDQQGLPQLVPIFDRLCNCGKLYAGGKEIYHPLDVSLVWRSDEITFTYDVNT